MSEATPEPVAVNPKARALLFLRRHLRELESQTKAPTAEEQAAVSMPYAQRCQAVARADAAADELRTEIDAYRDAIRMVEAAKE